MVSKGTSVRMDTHIWYLGMEQVEMTITKELQIGIGRLPASDFLHLFYEKAEIVLAKLHDVQKNWLLIVQQG